MKAQYYITVWHNGEIESYWRIKNLVHCMYNEGLNRGDVYLASITFPGYENKKGAVKYVVILQEGPLFRRSNTVSVLLLTTKHLESKFPTDVHIDPKECKSTLGAKILANQPHTILKSQLIKFKYSLKPETIRKMNVALAVSLGLLNVIVD